MGSFLQQVFNLLTTETGSLTYHLVLAFSIAGALQASLGERRDSQTQWAAHWALTRRMVIGFSLLLAFRLVLFFSSALAWQGLINPVALLPPIDRAVTLLSLLVIIWLWAFPEPLRAADSAIILLSLLTATLSAFGIGYEIQQGESSAFNGSLPDLVSGGYALVLAVAGALILLAKRPAGWNYGLAMLGLLFAGHAAHLAFPSVEGNYSGTVRLAQMVAYPLLLFLPNRLLAPQAPAPEHEDQPVVIERSYAPDPQVLQAALLLSTETDPARVCQAVTCAVSRAMQADMCLLVTVPQEDGEMAVRCGYDLIREENLSGSTFPAKLIPLLASTMRRGRPLRLPSGSGSPDLAALAHHLDLNLPGNLLAVPLSASEGAPELALLLLSPYSNHDWSADEQSFLTETAGSLVQVMDRSRWFAGLGPGQEHAAAEVSDQLYNVQRENQVLQEQLDLLRQSLDQEQAQNESLAAMVAAQADEMKANLARMEAENDQLRQASPALPVSRRLESGQAEGELLRLALEEVALLKAALLDVEQKSASPPAPTLGEAAMVASFQATRHEEIASIARELRQPMTSVVGYTGVLLGETVGILGVQQRRLLERIKISTERMARLMDDLIRSATPGGDLPLSPGVVDLRLVLDQVLTGAGPEFAAKSVALQIDLPERLPELNADRGALENILSRLLHNALSVTPAGGDVSFCGRVESSEGRQDYVLLQVTDEGGGISREDLPHLFSHLYREDHTPVPGVGESGAELTLIKTQVEVLGGRIWVDSNLGYGSTFSILLPVASRAPSPNGGYGG